MQYLNTDYDKKIYIVDDVEDNTFLLERYLRKIGYEDITVLNDPTLLMHQLVETGDVPDLFILDIMMPDLDGISLAKLIRNEKKYDKSSIVFATAKNAEDSLEACFEAGAQDFVNKPISVIELKYRIRNIFIVQNFIKDLVNKNENLTLTSMKDGLTEIYNRSYLDSRLSQEFSKCRRYQHKLCLLMLDIDFFKNINDTHGHPLGDEVLKAIAKLLQETVRASDIVARYGGEEFTILMPGTDMSNAKTLAERIRDAVVQTKLVSSMPDLDVTVSIGVSEFTSELSSAQELLERADKALYEAKDAGRNCVKVC